MLAKLAPRFVISRVIQNAYFVDMMNVELLKQPFGTHRNYFGTVNPEKFYVTTNLFRNANFTDTFHLSQPQLSSTTDLKLKHINKHVKSLKPSTKSSPLLKVLTNSIMNSSIFTVLSKETTAALTFSLITEKLLMYIFIKLVILT